MARYRANLLGFDGKQLREPGEEFNFDGAAAHWMDLLDDSGRTKKDIMDRLDQMRIAYSRGLSKDALAKLLDDAVEMAAEAEKERQEGSE
jgi:hypothetical protein